MLFVTGCSTIQLQYREDNDYMLNIDTPKSNDNNYKIVYKDDDSSYVFMDKSSKYAIVNNDYAIEINLLDYTYYTSISYRQKYGSKNICFDSYKEYLKDDKLFNKEIYTDFRELDDVDGIEYIYKNVLYRVFNTDDYSTTKYFQIKLKSLKIK